MLGGGGGGSRGRRERETIPNATLSPPGSALWWVAVRAVLIGVSSLNWDGGKSQRRCPQTTTVEEEKRAEAENRTHAVRLTCPTPYRWAKPAHTAAE